MEKQQAKAKGIVIPDGEPNAEEWSTQDKFQIVLETASLNEVELAEYFRKKGLYVEQVQSWKTACKWQTRLTFILYYYVDITYIVE